MYPKVQFRRAGRLLFLGCAVLGLCAGCEGGGPGATDEEQEDLGPFGQSYQVLSSHAPADPDLLPALVGDTLVALVGYSGGCEDHDFELEYRTAGDTTELWLQHRARGDDCEAYVTDSLQIPVPEEALAPATIVLLNPQGGPPHILRWGD